MIIWFVFEGNEFILEYLLQTCFLLCFCKVLSIFLVANVLFTTVFNIFMLYFVGFFGCSIVYLLWVKIHIFSFAGGERESIFMWWNLLKVGGKFRNSALLYWKIAKKQNYRQYRIRMRGVVVFLWVGVRHNYFHSEGIFIYGQWVIGKFM